MLTQDTAEALNSIRDTASALHARQQLDKIHEKMIALDIQAKNLQETNPQSGRIMALEKAEDDTIRAFKLLFRKRPDLYRHVSPTEIIRMLEGRDEFFARMDVGHFSSAIKQYIQEHLKDPNNKLEDCVPQTLDDIIKMKNKASNISPDGVNDPWGKPYRFSVDPIKERNDKTFGFYVWTISPYRDGKKVIGEMPPKR
ncbi:MAG: hypothetical protein JNJ77_05090 [Planctomycetia bacterium]|nr:hypothetical protein [Planctomycetia bacterium]